MMNPTQPTIGELFAKDVTRPIEGVIHADDAAHLSTEIDEFVLTGEVAGELSDLLETYTATPYAGDNGVWISGFYGSGKSHLLKMLAHLLGDVPGQTYPRQAVVDAFIGKATSDAMLRASLAKAARIPATALLFNIDQKAAVIDKSQTDALLQVFVKVFNEARGYFPGDPAVARFEKELDRNGHLADFEQAFERIAHKPWQQGREESIFQGANVTKAYAQVTGQPATESILTQYRQTFSMSIEDFADEVAQWLDEQPAGHRLIFLADEVGQYIGTNTKLMLNLQTLAESLNTRCAGRAWIAVTSQEDLAGVIGDQTKAQGLDFSKIQARFTTRMKLTSKDVEEVIEKRLLEKTDAAAAALGGLYDEQRTNFGTLFGFTDGSKPYDTYRDTQSFVDVYPFVPYQFPLFQEALWGLSDQNVFEGRHQAVGERSMLAVAQDAVKALIGDGLGALAPFDLMYEGVRTQVKSTATHNIIQAEQQFATGNPVAVRLLKALFLVKYVQGFHATPRNLTTLLYDHFGQDIAALGRQVRQGLDLLEQQTFVQRVDSTYEYLTNEEQEIEQEIKNTDVDPAEVNKQLTALIDDVMTSPSVYRHQPTGRDFRYELHLDGVPYSKAVNPPLAVDYVVPKPGWSREAAMAQSMGRAEVRVILVDDPRLYADLALATKTAKYIKVKNGTTLTETQRVILETKTRRNFLRYKELTARVGAAISGSELIINGAPIQVKATDPQARVSEGVAQLVGRTFTGLALLGGVEYRETDVATFVQADDDALLAAGNDTLQPAADDVAAWIARETKQGTMVTVKRIVDHYEDVPNGWPLGAILCAVARLFATSQVTLRLDGTVLKRTEVVEALRNGAKHAVIQVTQKRQYDPAAVQRLRTFAQTFFATGGLPNDPTDLAGAVKGLLARELADLTQLRAAYADRYPFVAGLDRPLGLLRDATTERPEEWYLDEFANHTDALLDAKEDIIDPVRAFVNGPQHGIYDEARTLVDDNRDNLGYLPDDLVDAVRALLDDPTVFRGQGMPRLRDAAAALRAGVDDVTQRQRGEADALVRGRLDQIRASAAWPQATESARDKVISLAEAVLARIDVTRSVPAIRQAGDGFYEDGFSTALTLLEASIPAAAPDDGGGDGPVAASGNGQAPHAKPAPIVSIKTLPKPAATLLGSVAAVDDYVEQLRAILYQAVESGKRVSL
jgi:hypothetical protein